MTFNEAVEEMKRLAGDGVWALDYEVASYHPAWIHGYIGDVGHAEHSNTYTGAIANVQTMIAMRHLPGDPAPEEEAA